MREIVVPTGWRERLEDVAGDRKQSWVVAGVVASVALVALLWSTRSSDAAIAPPATAPADAIAEVPAAGGASSSPSALGVDVLLVHVAGAVRRPGLYEISAGARIADAIDAAGGPRPRADLDALNLAEPLVDGAKIEVLEKGHAVVVPAGSTPSMVATREAVVNVNTADAAALESIPGLGPVKTAAILQYREEVGGFSALEQLLDVSGIGPATLESIRPYISL